MGHVCPVPYVDRVPTREGAKPIQNDNDNDDDMLLDGHFFPVV